MTDRLTDMIRQQRDLQEKHGHHFDAMSPVDRIEYIKEQVIACTDELHEALGEVGWKSWATSRHINAEAFFGELRDAWQFLTNLMLVVESDPVRLAANLERSLYEKLALNHTRHESGYDGVSGKCPHCRRALEEVPILEVPITADRKHVRYVCACGTSLDPAMVAPYIRD